VKRDLPKICGSVAANHKSKLASIAARPAQGPTLRIKSSGHRQLHDSSAAFEAEIGNFAGRFVRAHFWY
jgi:hypothetical protein